MRVGTKLTLLVVIPTCGLLVFAALSAIDQWRQADRLRAFRADTRLSFAAGDAVQALGEERTAVTLSRMGVRSYDRRADAARREVDAALRRADPRGRHTPVDVAGRLQTAERRLAALRGRVAAGSLGLQEAIEEYGLIARELVGIVRDVDARAPTLEMAKAADAHTAIVQAIDGGENERVTVALAIARGTETVRVRGTLVEAGALDAFRETSARPLASELDALLSSPPAATVDRVRRLLVSDPAGLPGQVPLGRWLTASDARIRGMLRLDDGTDGALRATASAGIDAAEASARRAVAASVGVLLLVVGLGLVLRRSIARPLAEVSDAARRLSAGQLASGVSYAGRDEIGDVAVAFRDVQVTADRLAEEIRAMNAAVEANRLDHRADAAALEGRWAELMGGINDTMAAFAGLQGRRERAERHADRIFELSHDLLCIAGFDGYFKRVNPAFARLLGHPTETMLSRPTRDFVHPDDRAARDARHAQRESGEHVRYE
jgi:PAS domain-containing protein